MDPAVVAEAVKRYARRERKDLNLLMAYAREFSVLELVRTRMEVLL
jgi:hypothetical protein